MASRQARPDTAASNVLSALALAVLGAWMNPALASSGVDTLCDRSTGNTTAAEVPHTPLTIQVVDHGAANSVAAGEPGVDEEVDASSTRQLRPRTDIILRRIFDDSRLADGDDARFADADALSAPLADEKSSDTEDASNSGDVPSRGQTATQLPGVSEDELLRFRQRMYRVDI